MNPIATRIAPAALAFTADGVPFSETFADVYHSADGGLGQARHVFLGGNDLPERWRGRETFTILETGFGLGLNFLATWAALREDPAAPSRLHFVSVEKHPFASADLRELHSRWPELAPLSRQLVAAWPPLIAGFHRLRLDQGRVTLTLIFGDAVDALPQLVARADAIYLDGFAPGKNPDLWSPSLFKELARLAAPGATLATYTVATAVREALAGAGFATEKRRGFASKREMLTGRRTGVVDKSETRPARRAVIIGAGLAGTACAERLAARGWAVEIVERHGAPAQEASGNPAGVLHPILNMAETANARLSRSAFLYAVRHARGLDGSGLLWGGNGLLNCPPRPAEAERLGQMITRHHLPEDFVRWVESNEATQLADHPVCGPGAWFPAGAWLNPPSLCAANLARHRARIVCHMNRAALRIEKTEGAWAVADKSGEPIATAPVVVLANAIDCSAMNAAVPLPLKAVRGQITFLPPAAGRHLDIAVTGDGYVSPVPGGGHCIGATFQHDDGETQPRDEDHAENLVRLDSMLPGFAAGVDATALQGRVAFRATTPDRLPIFGELQPGLYAAAGLGARGLLWAPLGAELIAALINGEPWPIEQELAAAVGPARFASVRVST